MSFFLPIFDENIIKSKKMTEMKNFLDKISSERCSDLECKNSMGVANIFDRNDAFDDRHLFLARFHRVPNWIALEDIDCKKAHKWFVENYNDKITDCSFVKRYKKGRGLYYDDVYYFLYEDLLVYLNENQSEARFLYRKTDSALIDEMVNKVQKFKVRKTRRKPEIEVLYNTNRGLSTQIMSINSPKFCIDDNYNDDFLPVHETILNRLRKKNDKGLVLLHGKPGTGKTTYIRYLITTTRKPVIFLPPNMAASITDPGLMNVLIDNPNSVFVIEDAENIIIDRNQRNATSSVSALLNLADGLLSDCLNIQLICSFNTDISRVDSALTRKGRLIAKYEFLELDAQKAQALSNKLGFSSIIDVPMTLTEVYNQHETQFPASAQRKRIGFNIAV
jgi:hypothetical protein